MHTKRKTLRNYLRTHRLSWALSQKILISLLGSKSCSQLSRYELRKRTPSLRIALACQVIFGIPPSELFKGIYDEVEEEVMQRAYRLYERYEHRTDATGKRKLQLLKEIMARTKKNKSRGV